MSASSASEGATPIVPGNGSAGTAKPGSSSERATPVETPRDQIRLGEEVGEKAEPREDRREPEVRGRHVDELDDEHVARLRALDEDRAREQVVREVDREQVVGRALEADLVAGPERGVERHVSPGLTRAIGSTAGCQRLCPPTLRLLSAALIERAGPIVELLDPTL